VFLWMFGVAVGALLLAPLVLIIALVWRLVRVG
jgi:hypothetical protein